MRTINDGSLVQLKAPHISSKLTLQKSLKGRNHSTLVGKLSKQRFSTMVGSGMMNGLTPSFARIYHNPILKARDEVRQKFNKKRSRMFVSINSAQHLSNNGSI